MEKEIDLKRMVRSAGLAALIFLLVVGGMASFKPVGVGDVAIKFNRVMGVVSEKPLEKGWHLIIPFVEAVSYFTVRSDTYTMSIVTIEGEKANRADHIDALTKDGVKVQLDITVRYRLDKNKVFWLYEHVSKDYETYKEKIMRPEMREAIRVAVKDVTWEELIAEKRVTTEERCFLLMQERLRGDGIIIEQVMLRNIALPVTLEKQLEDRANAQISIKTRQFELEQQQIVAKTRVIEAEGLANARVIQAKGTADALKIINEQLAANPDLLVYLWIDKITDKVQVIVVPQGGNYILPIPGVTTPIPPTTTPPPK